MKATCYLVFNVRGVLRATKGRTTLSGGEFAVRLSLDIPESVFAPALADVAITIPPRAVITPVVVVEGATEVQDEPDSVAAAPPPEKDQ